MFFKKKDRSKRKERPRIYIDWVAVLYVVWAIIAIAWLITAFIALMLYFGIWPWPY